MRTTPIPKPNQVAGKFLGYITVALQKTAQRPSIYMQLPRSNWFAFVALFPGSEIGVLAVANAAETMGGDAVVEAAARTVIQTLAPAAPPAP